jgi:hypothetical protein
LRARRRGNGLGALAHLVRQLGQREHPLVERIGEDPERAALGRMRVHHAPVELGHELAQRRGLDEGAQRALYLFDLERPSRLVGEVLAVAAKADERLARDVAESEPASGAQPEVEVLGEAEGGVVAADGLVDAAVDHARGVDERVVLADEVA